MSIEFEEEKFRNSNQPFFQEETDPGGIMGLFFKLKIVRSKNQANLIIIILTVIFFALSVVIFMTSS